MESCFDSGCRQNGTVSKVTAWNIQQGAQLSLQASDSQWCVCAQSFICVADSHRAGGHHGHMQCKVSNVMCVVLIMLYPPFYLHQVGIVNSKQKQTTYTFSVACVPCHAKHELCREKESLVGQAIYRHTVTRVSVSTWHGVLPTTYSIPSVNVSV